MLKEGRKRGREGQEERGTLSTLEFPLNDSRKDNGVRKNP